MATKTIPELNEITSIDGNALIPVDTGTQTYKIDGQNLADSLKALVSPSQPAVITSNTNLTAAMAEGVVRLNSTGGAFNLQLPDPATVSGKFWYLKDIGGDLLTYNVTLVRFGSEKIEQVAANFALESNYGGWRLYCDGTDFIFT